MLPQGQESSQDTQESQEQAPEEQGLSQEQPQDSSQEEAPEGQEDSQQAEGEEEEPEGEGEKPEAKPEVKHKRSGGYQRTIQRQERQIAQLTEAIQRLSGQPPQPTQPQKPKTDAERAADEFRSLVRQEAGALLAEERRQAEERQQQEMSRQLAQKWEAQLPADEDEAHEVRQWIADAHSRLRPGPLREALLTSEVTPRIISELLRNPLELARISALPEIQQAREVLRLETKFVSGAAPVKPGPAVRPPPPPSRVGGSASQTSTRRLEDLDIRSYKAAYRSGRR